MDSLFHQIGMTGQMILVKKTGKNRAYVEMTQTARDIIHSCCSDAHVKKGNGSSKRIDPALMLSVGAPVMTTDNIDVSKAIANGAMCTVKGITLKNGLQDHNIINVDGFFVRCVKMAIITFSAIIMHWFLPLGHSQIQCIPLRIDDSFTKCKVQLNKSMTPC